MEPVMPDKKTKTAAARDKRQGKSVSTQAGEYVHEEIEHIRKGKHGAKNAKQAIAIGLSKARRAGVKVKTSSAASAATRKKARQDTAAAKAHKKLSATRSRVTNEALNKEGGASAVSKRALSKQTKGAAKKRTASSRSAAARKAVRTKGAAGRSRAAKKAAATRKRAG
jgi:hypothetical protein